MPAALLALPAVLSALPAVLFAVPPALSAAPAAGRVAPFAVTGDSIEAPLDGLLGDPARGEAVVRSREGANCLICHSIPNTAERFMGEVGPPLAGVGERLSPGQLRLRLVDSTLVNPDSAMPPYHRVEGLLRVDPRFRGRPVLTAQEIEDVVAYLAGLRE
ncbi:sulfur oxidation c-type cytochrome SoxX [Roseomonas sp. BN140053]|uniref:sulfur oxidation c-type cytochrome SoxX n=1 Tax=Roseomonas sp. BN140053 TaxID=3391898 RepID=UPI0039E7F800